MGESEWLDVLEVLSEEECRELLASHTIGRIAFAIDDDPQIFPVNYVAEGSTVVFRTAAGTKLQEAAMRRVAFEVDGWDPKAGIGWSVVVKGVAQEVTKAGDDLAVLLRQQQIYPLAPGVRDQWIAVYPSDISGRRFHR